MKTKTAEGLYQISFFLSILFFVLTMFVVPIDLQLMLIFLLFTVALMTLTIMFAVNERATRKDDNKKGSSRVVPYL